MNPAFVPPGWNYSSKIAEMNGRTYAAVNDTNGFITGDIMPPQIAIPVSEILEKVSPVIENRAITKMLNQETMNQRYQNEFTRRMVDQFNTCYFTGAPEVKEILRRLIKIKAWFNWGATIEILEKEECGNGTELLTVCTMMLKQYREEGGSADDIEEWLFKLNQAYRLEGENPWETLKARVAVVKEFAEDFESETKWVDSFTWQMSDIVDDILNYV